MTDIRDEWVERAAEVIVCRDCNAEPGSPCHRGEVARRMGLDGVPHDIRLRDARHVIAAVAGDIRAEERDRIVAELRAEGEPFPKPIGSGWDHAIARISRAEEVAK